jgi:caffeoyl-CoA O-methyltransferase
MSHRTLQMTDGLYDYLLAHSSRESPLLARLREETARLPQARMQISPEQGQFLQLLIGLVGARHALEVGVFTGYSSLCVALALPGDGRLVACDVSEEWTGIARRYWREAGVAAKVDLRIAPALVTLESLVAAGEAGRFDFAFIDADKANYLAYYEHALALVRRGGLIAVDNTLWSGKVADPAVNDQDTVRIRELNDFIHRDERVAMSMLPIGDGLTLARKR